MSSLANSPIVPADVIAAAAERRINPATTSQSTSQINAEHEKRQVFRRLIDPGIVRPNPAPIALASLQTLLTIAENLLREPDNPKFQQFKTTNQTIKARLMDPKGTLEYAIALGFRAQVQNFQPLYVFNARKMSDLRIGAAILKETIDLEIEKQERAERSKKEEKSAAEAVVNKVKLAFMDDRKSKMMQDQREREKREIHATTATQQSRQSSPTATSPKSDTMPGLGHTLGMPVSVDDQPPDDAEDN